MKKQLLAGAARLDITPLLGTSLDGTISQNGPARYVHDPLFVRALVLDDGQERIALVVCDSTVVGGEVFEAAKQRAHGFCDILPERILGCATHTHSSPRAVNISMAPIDVAYREMLALRMADAIGVAEQNLAPARVGWGTFNEPRFVFNRRWRMKPGSVPDSPLGTSGDVVQMNPPASSENMLEPAGPVDPEVSVLSVQTAEGRPLAVLANYGLHYVGRTGGGHVSADYFGMFADRLAHLLGTAGFDPPFLGMMSNGTSGDVNAINFRQSAARRGPYEYMREVAYSLAEQVAKLCGGMEYRQHAAIRMQQADIALGVRLPSKDEIARAEYILDQAGTKNRLTREEVYARETVLLAEYPRRFETVVQAIRLGELGIAALPCEVFAETGLAIKRGSPLRPTFTMELANGYGGYLPTPDQHAWGGYETWRARSSFLEVQAEPKLRKAALELLSRVAGQS